MSDRKTLLQKINEASFAVNDVTLYLDTHPTDVDALAYFGQVMKERKQALEEYESQYEPLIVDCVKTVPVSEEDGNNKTEFMTCYPGEQHWTWGDGPIPWDNQPE